MVLIARVVDQVQGCLVKILSAVAHRIRRDFDLSIAFLVAGSLGNTLRLFALSLAILLGSSATLLGWRLRAKRCKRGGVSGLAISLTFSMIAILTTAVGGYIHFYLDQRAQEREGMEAALRPDGKSLNPNEASSDDHQRAQEREVMEDALRRDGNSPNPKEASSDDYERAQEREGMEDALRPDGKNSNPGLKEASSADHQRAISKEDFEKFPGVKLREKNLDIALLDVRKRDKAEISSLLGAMSVRFLDLSSFRLELADKTPFCHNRNETCQAPGDMDVDCRTMVGGLEKGPLEKRLLPRLETKTIVNLRRVPPLCTQNVPFFDTIDAHHKSLDEAVHRSSPNLPAPMGSQRIGRSAAPTCTWVMGTASTYNPSRTRHASDDMQTSSGELYDSTAWTAAIQIDLRELFGGVRYGKNYQPAFALVESGKKRLIVKINDVGPLTPGRAIDLNERSMRYFDPSLQLGLISDVKITPLPGKGWTPGPISDEQLIKLAIAE